MVVTIGIDVHKNTHCAVAIDEVGRPQGRPVTVRATDAGHRQLLRWGRREFPGRKAEVAVEDCRHVSGRLERALLDAAVTVLRVPPKLMAQTGPAPAPGASPTPSTRWPSLERRCGSPTCPAPNTLTP